MKSKKELLSTLWIFVVFNYLYCDLMGVMDSYFLKQYLTGNVEGMEINEQFLLYAAVLMEIPIAMILLSRILDHPANRWANIASGFIKTAVMVVTLFAGKLSLYYLFYAVIEIATTTAIVYIAWKWKASAIGEPSSYPA